MSRGSRIATGILPASLPMWTVWLRPACWPQCGCLITRPMTRKRASTSARTTAVANTIQEISKLNERLRR